MGGQIDRSSGEEPWRGKATRQRIRLTLLGRWSLARDDVPISIVPSGQRLIALLALRGMQPRAHLAGMLWPETTEQQARASLRSAVWRVRQVVPRTLAGTRHELALHPTVQVDVQELVEKARRLLDEWQTGRFHGEPDYARDLPHIGELLPGWYEDWVLFERERLHQLYVRALEALTEWLTDAGHFGEAVDAALAAVAAEPYRESAHRAVIKAYLAEGNHAEAMRQYQRCRVLLQSDLGIEPSGGIWDLITSHLSRMQSRLGRSARRDPLHRPWPG